MSARSETRQSNDGSPTPFNPEAFLNSKPSLVEFLEGSNVTPPFAYLRPTGEFDEHGQQMSELRVLVGAKKDDDSTSIPIEATLQDIQEAKDWYKTFSAQHRRVFFHLAELDRTDELPQQFLISQRLAAINWAIEIPGQIVPINS